MGEKIPYQFSVWHSILLRGSVEKENTWERRKREISKGLPAPQNGQWTGKAPVWRVTRWIEAISILGSQAGQNGHLRVPEWLSPWAFFRCLWRSMLLWNRRSQRRQIFNWFSSGWTLRVWQSKEDLSLWAVLHLREQLKIQLKFLSHNITVLCENITNQ